MENNDNLQEVNTDDTTQKHPEKEDSNQDNTSQNNTNFTNNNQSNDNFHELGTDDLNQPASEQENISKDNTGFTDNNQDNPNFHELSTENAQQENMNQNAINFTDNNQDNINFNPQNQDSSLQNIYTENNNFPGNNNKPKKKYTPFIIIGIILALILSAQLLSSTFNSLKYVSEDKTIYIFENEIAKTDLTFENKSNSSKNLNLKFSNYNSPISRTIAPNKTERISVSFSGIKEDTTMKASYGFLGLQKVKINIVVLKRRDIYFSRIGMKISGENGTDLSMKKFSKPNKKITFSVSGHNTSGKEFIRKYDLKVNGKTVSQPEAKWTGNNTSKTTLTGSYTFTKEGKYTIELGGIKTTFIVSNEHKPPKNGTILKNSSSGPGILKIENKFSHDVIVSISLTSSPKVAQKKCYIKAKSKATITGVKSGTYYLYTNSGKQYSSITKGFLENNTASKSSKTLNFKSGYNSYTVWNITLGVTKGNIGINSLNTNDLPE